mmetsp:Transcript_107/g.370  ORF Transcript_107/g.370 Transcript_107/m.370 type:complete len:307 (+) Transcript_107:1801-2721(+)
MDLRRPYRRTSVPGTYPTRRYSSRSNVPSMACSDSVAAAEGRCTSTPSARAPAASRALPPARPLSTSKGMTKPMNARTSSAGASAPGTSGAAGGSAPAGVHITSRPWRTDAKATGSSTAKHRSSSSALTANSPRRPARLHQMTSVSSATASRLDGFSAHSVRQLCSLSASLISITRGSSTMSSNMPSSAPSSSCDRRVGRLPRPSDVVPARPASSFMKRLRRSTCVTSPTRLTLLTSDATAGPNSLRSSSSVTGVSSTQSCTMVATTVSTARADRTSSAGTVAARMRAASMQWFTYGSPVLRCCPR